MISLLIALCVLSLGCAEAPPLAEAQAAALAAPQPPGPLLGDGEFVPWWFVFKLNAKPPFAGCPIGAERACPFGGEVQDYGVWGQQYAFYSPKNPALTAGSDCLGDATSDPLAATFDRLYNQKDLNYVLWNDQFYNDPKIKGCSSGSCGAPRGHSKGLLAWDASGEGFVLQVSTPSWPASGSQLNPRKTDGNSLGCVEDDDVEVSQHFFALALSPADTLAVLGALRNASVVTDPLNPQIVKNGGPTEIQSAVRTLGTTSTSTKVVDLTLSTGVRLISKPSKLQVPPWQLVSALLGGVPLRTATWWTTPKIPSTTDSSAPGCWADGLGNPGPVQIATTGTWQGQSIGLTGGSGADYNHAKLGVSTDPDHTLVIFGDMNQQGALSGKCSSSQNGRGGLFYVVDDPTLHQQVSALLAGKSG